MSHYRATALLPLLALTAALAAPARAEDAAPPATFLTSYGEINVNRPTRAGDTTADLRRLVVGVQHRFDEKTRLVTEIEIEHAVTSADDAGEVAVEQAFIERQLSGTWTARAGLVLVPLGLLNENHEPTAYYGVERNFVETAIIPSTWREGAVQVLGAFESGLTVQAGVGTSFNLNRWDPTSEEGRESPLAAIHQELQQARAGNVGGFAAADWRGVPGLRLGAAAFLGDTSQAQPGVASAVLLLWDVHARWTPGPLDLSALYARGTISGTASFNTPLVGQPYLVPEAFSGWYLQAAVRAWSDGDVALRPFARYERFNTAESFADLGAGLTPAAAPTEGVLTVGLNFDVAAGVVLKADYQVFQEASDRDRVDLGLGWSF